MFILSKVSLIIVFILGSQENIDARIMEHICGRTNYTSKKRPWHLVYVEEFENKTDALKENYF